MAASLCLEPPQLWQQQVAIYCISSVQSFLESPAPIVCFQLLSFTLFFINLKDFGWEGLLENIGIQLTIAAIVVAALSNTYCIAQSDKNLVTVDLLPFVSEITNQSASFSISLANHLRSIGAKLYGAFRCSHCLEQKEMFGREAAKVLEYVECFPDGVGKVRKIANKCELAKIEGFQRR